MSRAWSLLLAFLTGNFLSAADLDAILKAARPGQVLSLEAGIYTTRGCDTSGNGVSIPEGATLRGQGMSRTFIQFLPPETWDREMIVLRGRAGSTVSDLTVDGGVTTPAGWKRNVVSMVGDNCTVTRVRAIGPFGDRVAGREGFGIACHALREGGVGNNGTIDECEVVGVLGDYITALKVDGGRVMNSLVVFPEPRVGAFWTGLGWCRSPGALFVNNEVHNASNGAYTDTGRSTNVTLLGNRLLNVQRGVHVNAQHGPNQPPRGMLGLNILSNTIYFQASAAASELAAFQLVNVRSDYADDDRGNQNQIQNVRVLGNYVGYAPGVPIPRMNPGTRMLANFATTARRGSPTNGIRGVVFQGNNIQPALSAPGALVRRDWKLRSDSTVNAEPAGGWNSN
jgi:hypothetical protein